MNSKVLFLTCALIFPAWSFAQTDTVQRVNQNPGDSANRYRSGPSYDSRTGGSMSKSHVDNKPHPDGVMMQNGKMMVVHNGKMTAMRRDTTLSNGTIVMKDGTLIMKDGTKKVLKEGEHMDMTGNMVPMNRYEDENKIKTRDTTYKKNKDMYLVPDSSKKNYYEKK